MAYIMSNQTVQQVTPACFNWCREQHFAHQSNLTTNGIFILVLVFLCLIIFYIITTFHKQLLLMGITEEAQEKILYMAIDGATFLTIGFFIWFFFLM